MIKFWVLLLFISTSMYATDWRVASLPKTNDGYNVVFYDFDSIVQKDGNKIVKFKTVELQQLILLIRDKNLKSELDKVLETKMKNNDIPGYVKITMKDYKSQKKLEEAIYYTVLFEFAGPHPSIESLEIGTWEFDCKNNRIRPISFSTITNGREKPLGGLADWGTPRPDSDAYKWMRLVCNK